MKRIVIKVGSSTITHPNGLLNLRKIDALCCVLSDLKNAGHEIILVSSGAIAAGRGKMNIANKPTSLEEKQAVASVGQCELMYIYDKFFSQYAKTVGQLLLTKRVIDEDVLRHNATNTLNTLLQYGVIPIINENDSVAIDEIVFGDNDTLSAITAKLVHADVLVILSDIDGLYDKNPTTHKDAKKIDIVYEVNDEIMAMAEDTSTNVGTGGMITKLHAAKICSNAHCDMVIASGENPAILYDIVDGKICGTLFKAKGGK